jgi:molybdate transport system ATP-binding protein
MSGGQPRDGIEARFVLARETFVLDVDFAAPGRGITGVFGPSGAGKTTLLRCIAGLERARGRCRVKGGTWQDEAGVFLPTHRRPLGYVFQEASLFPHLSVRGNLEYGWRRIAPARRRIGFEDATEWLGLRPLLERSPTTLSGGERQRVAIARALLTSPDLLLADEPLAGLDEASKAEILPYLDRLHDELELPILYVTHSLDEISRIAEHLVVLRDGRAIGAGPVAELMTRVDLPLAHRDDASAIVAATVAGLDEAYHLMELAFPGGTLYVPGDLQRLGHGRGTPVRVRVFARDVSLTLAPPERTSILNILSVTVREVVHDRAGQTLIRVEAGGVPLLARITAKSAAQLRLGPGVACHAQIKGVALLT